MKTVKLLFILVVIILCASALSLFYFYNTSYDAENTSNTIFKSVVLGKTDYGTVIREGPYGNVSSENRIVYIVGVHPLEYQAHETVKESLISQNNSLEKCYYIYQVNVTQDADNYKKGRLNGEKLANQYAVPDIKNMSIDLVIDVHSNEANGGYQEIKFLYIPQKSEKAEKVALEITNQIKWLTIYSPPNPTSPAYVTIPLIKSGIPTIIYETYTYQSYEQTKKESQELVAVVDNLIYKNND